jgi:uncharacterized membrane protein SpoIIM required for sporulation
MLKQLNNITMKTFKIFVILFFIFITSVLIYRSFVPVPADDISLMDQEYPTDTTNNCNCILDDDF